MTYLSALGGRSDGFSILDFQIDQLGAVSKDDFSISASNQRLSRVGVRSFGSDNILTCSNLAAIYVLGKNQDELLHNLIPEAEQFQKWVSICEFCVSDGVFDYEGTIVCRACRQDLISKEKEKQNTKNRFQLCTNKAKKRKLSFSFDSSSSSVEIVEENKHDETLPSMTPLNTSQNSEKVINIT